MGQAIGIATSAYSERTDYEINLKRQCKIQEYLDRIQNLNDLESEYGKKEVEETMGLLKEITASDGESAPQKEMKIQLPWDCVHDSAQQQQIKEEIVKLNSAQSLLAREIDELPRHFDFDMQTYLFQAVMLTKMYEKLADTRDELVPTLVSEETFWRNYFFEVEAFVESLTGSSGALGCEVSAEEREKLEQMVDHKLDGYTLPENPIAEMSKTVTADLMTPNPLLAAQPTEQEMVELKNEEDKSVEVVADV